MIENTRSIDRTATVILILGLTFILAPLLFVLVTATQSYGDFVKNNFSLVPGGHLVANLREVWLRTDLPWQTVNSIIISLIAAFGRVFLALTTAFAVVFFAAWYRPLIYAAVLASIMLPLELMIITAYQVTANVAMPLNWLANIGGWWAALTGAPLNLQLSLLDTYAGIAIPLMAQGTATLILVQFFRDPACGSCQGGDNRRRGPPSLHGRHPAAAVEGPGHQPLHLHVHRRLGAVHVAARRRVFAPAYGRYRGADPDQRPDRRCHPELPA